MTLPHSRFWGQLEHFRLLCPRCQTYVIVNHGKANVKHTHLRYYDRIHQVLQCPGCQMKSTLGLLMWPTNASLYRTIPPDVKLTIRQRAELRSLVASWWVDTPRSQDSPVNLWIPAECTCAPAPWRADCPVHGTARVPDPIS